VKKPTREMMRAWTRNAMYGGMGMVDRESLAARLLPGDYDPLESNEPVQLEPFERRFLVDLLNGKIKNPRHRPRGFDAQVKRCSIVQSCILQKKLHPDWERPRILAEVADFYGLSETYVGKTWRETDEWTLMVMDEFVDGILSKN
jgi:hypothetical protein